MEPHYATIWEAVADVVGDADALVQGDVRRTWSAFDDRAARLATAFRRAGLGPGSKVGLLLYNAPEYMETYFAALKIRAVPFNVNYRYLQTEIAYLLENADAEALVFHASLADRLGDGLRSAPNLRLVLVVDDVPGMTAGADRYEDAIAAHVPAPRMARDPDDITMIYTGGTTGMPKGVMGRIGDAVSGLLVSAPSMLGERPAGSPEEAVALAQRRVAEDHQFVSIPAAPLMHATALGLGANPALLFGARLALLNGRRFDPHELWDVAEREGAHAITVVGDPFARPMVEALDAGPPRLGSVTLVASSGAMFSTPIKQRLLGHLPGAAILDLIAATEGVMGMSISVRDGVTPTGTFTPSPGVIVVDEDGRPIPPGDDRAGLVALPGGARGYFKDPAKTAATFREIDGVRYTLPGDFATIAADGTLSLLGRGSQCINTAGEKVFPEEVEEAFKSLPEVADCLVVGLPDERFGQRVAAVVSLTAPVDDLDELIEAVRGRLASFKAPRAVIAVDVVPRSPVGKADYPEARRLLRAAGV